MHEIHAIKVDEMSVFEFGCCRKRELDTSSVVLHGLENGLFHFSSISLQSYNILMNVLAVHLQRGDKIFLHTHAQTHTTTGSIGYMCPEFF